MLQIIIVLGNSKPTIAETRVRVAIKVFRTPTPPIKNTDGSVCKYILFSGGEAHMMRKMATMPEECCLYEPNSHTTVENLQFSFNLIREKFGNTPLHIVICTSSFHICRTKTIATDVFLGYMPSSSNQTENKISFEHPNETVSFDEYQSEAKLIWTYLMDMLKVRSEMQNSSEECSTLQPAPDSELVSVQYLSDLHLEHDADMTVLPFSKTGDVLVLAGDICTVALPELFLKFIAFVCNEYELVLFVPGNHEYYGSSITDGNAFFSMMEEKFSKFYCLNNKTLCYRGRTFIGSSLWSNIPEKAADTIRKEINDYSLIKNFTVETCNKLHKESVNFLEKAINDNKDKQIVVITHHAPLVNGTSHPRFNGAINNAAFATDLSLLVSKVNGWWICGHTHYNNRIKHGLCNVVLNCRGYKKDIPRFNGVASFWF